VSPDPRTQEIRTVERFELKHKIEWVMTFGW
jgi:hypothetical protein